MSSTYWIYPGMYVSRFVSRRKRSKGQAMPKSEDELLETVSKLWNNLPDVYYQKLHASMSIRIQKVKTVKGCSTKY